MNVRFVLVLCTMLFSFSTITIAQPSKFVLTINPLTFIEPDAGFTPGISYNLPKNMAVSLDAGIIFFYPYATSNVRAFDVDRQVGFKLKPAFRYYFQQEKNHDGTYIEGEGLYKQVDYRATEEVPVFDNSGNFAYNYSGGYNIKKQVTGFSVKIGYTADLGNSKRVFLDVYGGLGGRNKSFFVSGLPPNTSIPGSRFDRGIASVGFSRGGALSFPLGLKIRIGL